MTPSELVLYNGLNIQQQYFYLINAYAASTIAPAKFQDAADGGKQDAFRHSFFHALNTQHLGVALSRSLGDAHENFLNNPILSKSMDLHNNEQGRIGFLDLHLDASEHDRPVIRVDVENMILNLMATGNMQYIKNGVLVPTNQ